MGDFPVVISVPVHWGDQDAFGHVNNTVYLRWSETARIEYLARIGIWQQWETEKIGPIVASITCNYRRPVTYPDTISVGARVTSIGNSSFRMAHTVVSAAQGAVAADVETVLVMFDYNTGTPVPVPQEMRQAIRELEGRELERAPA